MLLNFIEALFFIFYIRKNFYNASWEALFSYSKYRGIYLLVQYLIVLTSKFYINLKDSILQ